MKTRPLIRIPSLIAMVSLFYCAASLTYAQDFKIGVVDMKQVTERSTALGKAIDEAEAPMRTQKDELDLKMNEFQRKREMLQGQETVLSDEERQNRERELRDLREEIQDMEREIQRQYNRIEMDLMRPVMDRILELVRTVAKEENFDLVIPSELAIYHTDKIDLTPLVIQRLDREGLNLPELGERETPETEERAD